MEIRQISAKQFYLCGQIWDLNERRDLAKQFLGEITSGNRTTWLYFADDKPVGEISLVRHMDEPDYTIPGKRAYLSHLLVLPKYRNRGIAGALITHLLEQAKNWDYQEVSLGVDLDNYPAIKLYTKYGFDKIICADQDKYGKYIKLLKTL